MNQTGRVAASSAKHFVPQYSIARELIAQYGSPLYVYDATTLRETMESVRSSVRYPNTKFAFAAVTNGNVELLKFFRNAGWQLHANTPGDAYLALKAGFQGSDIVYSGSNLTREEMRQMLEWRVATFNLDSISQLRLLGTVVEDERDDDFARTSLRLGFRLNLPQITGESRIGISPDMLPQAESVAAEFGLQVSGVHFYRGTSTNATERFEDCIPLVLAAGARLKTWKYLDFGGGFGFAYFDRNHKFEWSQFGSALGAAVEKIDRSLELLIEPGRSVIAGSGVILCTVLSAKEFASGDGRRGSDASTIGRGNGAAMSGPKQVVGVDCTTSNVAVLSVHGGVRQARILRPSDDEPNDLLNSDVCGNTTYSRDYLARSCMLPKVREGDVLAILDCGAYGYAMSSHFLHRPRLPEILIESGQPRLIRRRETYDCLLQNQVGFE